MTYDEWAARWPQAAADLTQVLAPTTVPETGDTPESQVQQRIRLDLAKRGILSWRNNVGATPAACRSCGAKQQPVRYGLANDSHQLNQRIKSSDLILGIPRVIGGKTILQLGGIEVKKAGWTYTGTGREAAQAAWLTLLNKNGGFGIFSTGTVDI